MTHTMEFKIYYEDTDCGGIVYYGNYMKYMEWGRTEFLYERGVSLKTLMDQGTLFVVTRAEIEYRSYAQYGDVLNIQTKLTDVTAATIVFEHALKEKKSGRLIAEGMIRLACVNKAGKPKRIPHEMMDKLK